jgi:hypothetical protein
MVVVSQENALSLSQPHLPAKQLCLTTAAPPGQKYPRAQIKALPLLKQSKPIGHAMPLPGQDPGVGHVPHEGDPGTALYVPRAQSIHNAGRDIPSEP